MMASEFDMHRANHGSSPTPEAITFSSRPPSELRRLEAQSLQGLEGPALRAALGVRTWTTRHNHLTSGGFGFFAALCAACGFVFVGRDMLVAIAVSIVIAVACGVMSVASFFAEQKPGWVRLDPTGFTCGGPRLLWPSAAREMYRWADCGPFVVSRDCEGTWLRSDPSPGSLGFMSEFGDEHDIATILNAYRSVYGGTPQR